MDEIADRLEQIVKEMDKCIIKTEELLDILDEPNEDAMNEKKATILEFKSRHQKPKESI